jgi:hypothetical protein
MLPLGRITYQPGTPSGVQTDGSHLVWGQNCVADGTEPPECEILDHQPHSPNLTLSDVHLFRPLKEHLAGKQFAPNGDM